MSLASIKKRKINPFALSVLSRLLNPIILREKK